MSETGKLELERVRGVRAQRLMEDDLLKEALSVIRGNIRDSWETSKANDKDGREDAWKMMKVVNEFERHLRSVMGTGKMAEAELTRLQGLVNKIKPNFSLPRY